MIKAKINKNDVKVSVSGNNAELMLEFVGLMGSLFGAFEKYLDKNNLPKELFMEALLHSIKECYIGGNENGNN